MCGAYGAIINRYNIVYFFFFFLFEEKVQNENFLLPKSANIFARAHTYTHIPEKINIKRLVNGNNRIHNRCALLFPNFTHRHTLRQRSTDSNCNSIQIFAIYLIPLLLLLLYTFFIDFKILCTASLFFPATWAKEKKNQKQSIKKKKKNNDKREKKMIIARF